MNLSHLNEEVKDAYLSKRSILKEDALNCELTVDGMKIEGVDIHIIKESGKPVQIDLRSSKNKYILFPRELVESGEKTQTERMEK